MDGVRAMSAPGGVPPSYGRFIGEMVFYEGHTLPALCLEPDGRNVSRTTYAALFAAVVKSATATVTIATPGVVSWTAHGLKAGDPFLMRTSGALPTGITANTVYYVLEGTSYTANAFRFSATPGGAAVNTSGSQSGVHTIVHAPHGDGDHSTTFGLPDWRGYVPAGRANLGGTDSGVLNHSTSQGIYGTVPGATGGEQDHTLTTGETPANVAAATNTAGGSGQFIQSVNHSATAANSHNLVQPTRIVAKLAIFAGA
jgi:microcystin-dependent protein